MTPDIAKTAEMAHNEALLALALRAGDAESAAVMNVIINTPETRPIGFCRTEKVIPREVLRSARAAVEIRLGMLALTAAATAGEA